jgi:hypothetical protein
LNVWSVPAGELSWNVQYRWTVSIGDGDARPMSGQADDLGAAEPLVQTAVAAVIALLGMAAASVMRRVMMRMLLRYL